MPEVSIASNGDGIDDVAEDGDDSDGDRSAVGGKDDGGYGADLLPLDGGADFLPGVSLAPDEDGFDDDAKDGDDSDGDDFVKGGEDGGGRDLSAAGRDLTAPPARDDFGVRLFALLPADAAVIVDDGGAWLDGDADAGGVPAVEGDGNAPATVLLFFLC